VNNKLGDLWGIGDYVLDWGKANYMEGGGGVGKALEL
jgi:hypothetical protein